jgi:hypothetical protein
VPPHTEALHFHICYTPKLASERAPNLLTVSLDDAEGNYRGAGHRHANDQRLTLSVASASPGLVPGPLPEGAWLLTLSAHAVVSPSVSLSIQVGADTAGA